MNTGYALCSHSGQILTTHPIQGGDEVGGVGGRVLYKQGEGVGGIEKCK